MGIFLGQLLGELIALSIVLLLYGAVWKISKKRKIGLTWASFLALLFTPVIACIVSLCTKKIDATIKEPTYKQRLPFENTTALLIAAILYFCFGLLTISFNIVQFNIVVLNIGIIFVVWGYRLIKERRGLLLAKKDVVVGENIYSNSDIDFSVDGFVFNSNMQQKIESDNRETTAHCPRRVILEQIGGDKYLLSVINTENEQLIMNSIEMHIVHYWRAYECISMISDDNIGLKVYYKDDQVYKCAIELNGKNTIINYWYERNLMIGAKDDMINSVVNEPCDLFDKASSFVPLFVFDSNKQERIEVDKNNLTRIAYYPRRVVVDHDNEGRYRVRVIDTENDKLVLRPVIMHKLSCSSLDECDSMVSDNDQGEYKLNVFYKNGQVDKCVICRKSNNIMFHYCKE